MPLYVRSYGTYLRSPEEITGCATNWSSALACRGGTLATLIASKYAAVATTTRFAFMTHLLWGRRTHFPVSEENPSPQVREGAGGTRWREGWDVRGEVRDAPGPSVYSFGAE